MLKTAAPKHSILRNQRGILTLDFIFAILMMFTFAAILFGFSMTFTAVEVAQYATFSSARAYFAAGKNSDEQKKAAEEKFKELIRDKNSTLGIMFRNGWFELGDPQIDDFSSEFSTDPNKDSDTFVGVRSAFKANILNMKMSVFGSTTEDEYTANISSYLMREPTEEECFEFVNTRFQVIQQLKSGFGASYVDPNQYAIIADDGC